VARYPAEHNTLPCPLKVGHLNQNLSDDGMVRRLHTEPPQGTSGICVDEMILPRLIFYEQESWVYSIEFGIEDAAKFMEPISK
jgi:hypothetical protein